MCVCVYIYIYIIYMFIYFNNALSSIYTYIYFNNNLSSNFSYYLYIYVKHLRAIILIRALYQKIVLLLLCHHAE